MFAHPYASILHKVERPGRYVGGEFGAATPPEDVEARIALAFPDLYEIGMSHMGLSVLYEAVARTSRFGVERAFMPWPDMEAALREADLPLVALESCRPLRDFDVVGFSLQYELTYTNLLVMLDLGRIPRRAADRGEGDPIVIVGGSLAMHCEPLAPAVDIAVLGDGEDALLQVLDIVAEGKRRGHGRAAILERLAGLPFCAPLSILETHLDPLSHKAVVRCDGPIATRAFVPDLGTAPSGLGPVPTVEAVFDRYSLEIGRGCASGCRFCQAGYLYRPIRERSEQACRSAVERAVSGLGFDEVSLASLSTADHSAIAGLLTGLGEDYTQRRVSFSVPSLRAYGLSNELVEVLGRLRRSGVTLAPEAGSQSLRDAINKNVTEEDLLAAASRFFEHGFHRIKLYFMIGLPGETDEDLAAIVELGVKVRNLGRGILRGKRPEVAVSASTFVPKPFTPLCRELMIDVPEIQRRHGILLRACRDNKLELKIHDPRLSFLEGLLCRGDRRLFEVLSSAVDLGARFDGWAEQYNDKAWTRALADVDTSSYLAALPENSRTPWDHLCALVTPRFLDREAQRARGRVLTEPCGRVVDSQGEERFVCHACGLNCRPEEVPLRSKRSRQEATQPTPRQPRPKGKPRPQALTPQPGQDTRVLFWLAKWGRQGFVGHLDTQRHLMRSLRRAGLEVVYSQGFHPKPKLSSCPPLPMGMAALEDPWEVHLLSPPPEPEIAQRLNRALPADMAIVRVQVPAGGSPALSRLVRAGRYAALVQADRSCVEEGLARLMASPELFIERRAKGGQTKSVDLRPFLLRAQVIDATAEALRLPEGPGQVAVEFLLDMPGSGGARVSELLVLALGEPFSHSASVRTEVLLGPRASTGESI